MSILSLIAEHHILIVVILAEWVVLLMVAAIYLLQRQRRLNARLVRLASERQTRDTDNGLLDYLRQCVQALIRAYRGRWGDKVAVLQRGDILKAPEQAAQVAVQLQYDLLRTEIANLQKDGDGDPARQRAAWEHLLARFTEAQRTLDRFEEALRERHAGEAAHDRRQYEQAQEALNNKLRRRDLRIEQLEQRLADLEGYRERFNTLHQQVLDQQGANTELRRRLRDSVERSGDSAAEAALQSCDRQAGELHALLDQPDIAPLAGQRPGRPETETVAVRAARTQRLAEVGAERLAATLVTMRESLLQQQKLVNELRTELDSAGLREGQLKSYYQQQVRRLQEMVDQFRGGMDGMEKENLRARRTIRRLSGELRALKEDSGEHEALEATIDRFATQAIDMQRRIMELETALQAATAEALRSADEDTLPASGANAP